jgi:integrase
MSTVRQRGDSWQALVRISQGGLKHEETKSFPTERLAREWARAVELKVKDQGVPSRRLNVTTLGVLVDRYQKAREAVRPMRRAMHHELGQLAQELGDLKLDKIKVDTLTQWAMKRRKVAGPATVLHNLATLRSIFSAADPMFGLQLDVTLVPRAIKALSTLGAVAKGNSRSRRATQAEIDALVLEFKRTALYPSTVIPMEVIVPLAIAFPRRLGELTTMRWADWKEGQMTLFETKNPVAPRTEVVPVPPPAVAILNSLPKIDELILPYKADSVSAAFDRGCVRTGIEDLHFHDLRHEGISRLFETGLTIPEVALISGHLSWNTLKRYTHLKPEDVVEKMNARSQAKQKAGL